MAPTRKVCHRQLELLVEFAEANRRVVLGGLRTGPLGKREANKAWDEVSRRLNSIGGGVTKNPETWKRYWHLLKCRTKIKAADIRRKRVGPGGGPNKSIPLSDFEERIVAVIGKKAMEGNPEVRIPFDPTPEIQPTPACSHCTAPASSSIPSTAPAAVKMGLEFVDINEESAEAFECPEVKQENSFFEQPTEPRAPSPAAEPQPSAAPALSERATVRRSAPVLPAPSLAGASGTQSTTQSTTQSRPRRNRDENLPGWAYDLEERRIAVEERLVAEIAGVGQTNKGILACLEQLVQLLASQASNQAP